MDIRPVQSSPVLPVSADISQRLSIVGRRASISDRILACREEKRDNLGLMVARMSPEDGGTGTVSTLEYDKIENVKYSIDI